MGASATPGSASLPQRMATKVSIVDEKRATDDSVVDVGEMSDSLFERLEREEEKPNAEQRRVLDRVRSRLQEEGELCADSASRLYLQPASNKNDPGDEPLRGISHGLPGTGKSRLLQWIVRIFKEAMQWHHGVHFLCVAFQDRVVYASGEGTVDSADDVPVRSTRNDHRLSHRDIRLICTRKHSLR